MAAPARSVAAGRPLHDAASSRAWDAAAVAAGVSGVELMAAAGGAAARTVRYRFPRARRVLCVCGGGANGGDGLVVARLLRAAGRDARAVVVGSARYTGDAAWAHAGAQEADVPIEEGDADLVATRLRDADLVVDGLLGTGFSGPPRPGHAAVIDAVNAGGVPVLALDVPSGVDASTGEVPGPAIEAAVTVTFGAAKLGLVVAPGLHHAGDVVEVAIGHPAAAEVGTPAVRVGRPELRSLPARGRGGSKYDAGNVLLVGGSTGMTGAITLASLAALRGGAGIVSACVPASLNPILEAKLTEPMTRPCPDLDGGLAPEAADVVLEAAARADAVVLGPGIGRAPGTAQLVQALAREIPVPLVLDADGLHALAGDLELVARRSAPVVLTPHGGEAARLLGVPSDEVRAHRLETARSIARRAGGVCLLKGVDTIVADPDGRVAVRDGDLSALATAGTGDVLAGLTGAFLARGLDPWWAAALAAAAHLEAARSAVHRRPGVPLLAGDLLEQLAP